MNWTKPTDFLNVSANASTTTPDPSSIDEIMQMPQYVIAGRLRTISLWVFTTIGLIGNSLSLVTILRIPPLTSSSLYVVFLAVIDSCALVFTLIVKVFTQNISIGDAGCRSLSFLANAFTMAANWLVVAMTAERLIAVWFPLKVSAISTKTKTFLVYIMCVVVSMGINVVYLFMFKEYCIYVTDKLNFVCGMIPEFREFYLNVFYSIDAAFYSIMPCCLLLIFNTLIMIGTWRSLKRHKQMTQNQDQLEEKRQQQNQITAMLVTVSVTFLLTMLVWQPTTNAGLADSSLVEAIILSLSDSNHAVNFFLYFLSGRRFRCFLKLSAVHV